MKKTLVVLLALLMLLAMGACGKNVSTDSAKSEDSGKKQIAEVFESDDETVDIDEEQAVSLAVECARQASENNEYKVDPDKVHIYDSNEDAYLIFVAVCGLGGDGWQDVIRVDRKTGNAKVIDGVQDEWPGMYDVSTGKKLY